MHPLPHASWEATQQHPGWPVTLGPLLVGAGQLRLRPARWRDGPSWSGLSQQQRGHLEPWEPDGPGSWDRRHSLSAWSGLWWKTRSAARAGRTLPWAIELDGEFVGQVAVSEIERGAVGTGWLGYWVSATVHGRGIATAAVAMASDHALGPGAVHRVQATVSPNNAASIRVLRRNGYQEEGLLRRCLHVAGRWQDHLLLALCQEDLCQDGRSQGAASSAGRPEFAARSERAVSRVELLVEQGRARRPG